MPLLDLINRYNFVVRWSDEDLTFISSSLELPGVKAHGIDAQTAINELKTALLISLEWMQEEGESLPQPIHQVA
jgi:predicted RNase H-like HicB family nuclease